MYNKLALLLNTLAWEELDFDSPSTVPASPAPGRDRGRDHVPGNGRQIMANELVRLRQDRTAMSVSDAMDGLGRLGLASHVICVEKSQLEV